MLYMCAHVCAGVCMYTCMQRPEIFSFTPPLLFLRQDLSLNLELTICLSWLASKPEGSLCPHFSRAVCCCVQLILRL